MIPIKWKLTGMEKLDEEFEVVSFPGELKPTQEAKIDIKFRAIKERKLNLKLNLEVEDIEGLGLKQEVKTITVEAEAFDISVELKFPDNN